MIISEAVKGALKQGRGIARKSELDPEIWFKPISFRDCIWIMNGNEMLDKRWNPSADDLTAQDWMLK